ncbi:MAG: SulP family inorganic anion transporter [Bryobacteraceae bacterium]|nr:SulP family inorganic anion transporter [Bryobacteraceae bacterium]
MFRYGWKQFGGDVSGGVLAALIALPYGLAIARLMDLPPVLGLFTSILTAPFTGLLGRNPMLIGGASSVTVPFLAAAVRSQGIGGAAKVTIVAAVVMLVFSVLRLGRYAARVPNAVMAGFSCGIGGMMVISQLRTIFGLTFAVNPDTPMLLLLLRNLEAIGETQGTTALTGAAVVVVSAALGRFHPRLPAPLAGIVAGTGIAYLAGWHVGEIGSIPSGVPSFAGFSWTPADVWKVLPSGFALGFVASVNLLVTSRIVDHFRGRNAQKLMDADRELGAYGIANLAAGMFGAPMSVGIPARSLAAIRCGGSTPMANLLHAGLLAAAVVWLGPVLAHIPLAALAGVTAWMGFSLMSWGTWARLPKMRRVDAAGFLVTAAAVLAWNAVVAILLGSAVYVLRSVVRRNLPSGIQRWSFARGFQPNQAASTGLPKGSP